MSNQETTFRDILSWASWLSGVVVVLSLVGVLAWVFSPPGGWCLPAGGAVAGGVMGWKNPSSRSAPTKAVLTYAVRGAVLGLLAVFVYQSACTPAPKEPGTQEPKQEMLVQPSSADSY